MLLTMFKFTFLLVCIHRPPSHESLHSLGTGPQGDRQHISRSFLIAEIIYRYLPSYVVFTAVFSGRPKSVTLDIAFSVSPLLGPSLLPAVLDFPYGSATFRDGLGHPLSIPMHVTVFSSSSSVTIPSAIL